MINCENMQIFLPVGLRGTCFYVLMLGVGPTLCCWGPMSLRRTLNKICRSKVDFVEVRKFFVGVRCQFVGLYHLQVGPDLHIFQEVFCLAHVIITDFLKIGNRLIFSLKSYCTQNSTLLVAVRKSFMLRANRQINLNLYTKKNPFFTQIPSLV